jgi:RNA polymerase sigma factor (sigma-70 family)
MNDQTASNDPTTGKDASFTNTRWTLIAAARCDGSPGAAEALETLCRTYWYPLYVYVRRRGHNAQDAEDLTQAFFYHLLQRHFLESVDRQKGRFRSFLLASLNHFLSDQRDMACTQKRDGGRPLVSLDGESPGQRFHREPASDDTPEKMFDRRWALTVLEQAQTRLRHDYQAHGKAALFERLKAFLDEAGDLAQYRKEAVALGMTPGAVAVAVHRLRERYQEMILAEVSRTVSDQEEIESEYRYLREVLSGGH